MKFKFNTQSALISLGVAFLLSASVNGDADAFIAGPFK